MGIVHQRAQAGPDVVARRADAGKIPQAFGLGLNHQQEPVIRSLVATRYTLPDALKIRARGAKWQCRGCQRALELRPLLPP